MNVFNIMLLIIIIIEATYVFKKSILKIKEEIKKNKQKKNIDIDYYRDVIKNYSVYTLCKLLDKRINYKDQMIATMLKLKIEKKIDIEDGKIKLLFDNYERNKLGYFYKSNQLTESENFVLRLLLNTDVDDDYYVSNFIHFQSDEMLIYEKNFYNPVFDFDEHMKTDLFFINNIKTKFNSSAVIKIIIFIFFTYISFIMCDISIFRKAFIIITILANFMLFSSIDNPIKLTEKGKEIKLKLLGLKKFLNEFSDINKKTIENVELLDYYIVFAIIFNIKGKINKSAYDAYKKYIFPNEKHEEVVADNRIGFIIKKIFDFFVIIFILFIIISAIIFIINYKI